MDWDEYVKALRVSPDESSNALLDAPAGRLGPGNSVRGGPSEPSGLASLLSEALSPPEPMPMGLLSALFAEQSSPPNKLRGLLPPPALPPVPAPSTQKPEARTTAPVARRVFFSFHYGIDIWRATNIRNSWIGQDRAVAGFFDASLWERSKRTGDESLKSLIRNGMKGSTVTCVLAGEQTYLRPWVRYEIVQSIIRGNGLLTVHIDGVRNQHQQPGIRGPNPLEFVGVYKSNDRIFFAERKNDDRWYRYDGFTNGLPVGKLWFPPPVNGVVPLSRYAHAYDWATEKGRENLGRWVRYAAKNAGK